MALKWRKEERQGKDQVRKPRKGPGSRRIGPRTGRAHVLPEMIRPAGQRGRLKTREDGGIGFQARPSNLEWCEEGRDKPSRDHWQLGRPKFGTLLLYTDTFTPHFG